jgi:hypothetical protein
MIHTKYWFGNVGNYLRDDLMRIYNRNRHSCDSLQDTYIPHSRMHRAIYGNTTHLDPASSDFLSEWSLSRYLVRITY